VCFLGPLENLLPTQPLNNEGKSVEELLVDFRHQVLLVSTQPSSNYGYVAFKVAEEAERFVKRINVESIYKPIALGEWYGFMNACVQLPNYLNF